MKKIRLRTVAIFSLAGLSGGLLLYTSQNVQQAERELYQIKSAVRQEEESIRVLNAEWAYLNSPERLEVLASEYLGLAPAAPGQILPGGAALPVFVQPEEEPSLLHEISQQSPAAIPESVKPAKKPLVPQGGFNSLIKKLGAEGGE